jgi:hypothetical protein
MDSNAHDRDHRDHAVYVFAELLTARDCGDLDKAAEAKSRLQRIGIDVNFQRELESCLVWSGDLQ